MSALRSRDIISVQVVAATLDCTVQHARLLIRSGKIKGEKLGRDWFTSAESLQEFEKTRSDWQKRVSRKILEQRALFDETQYQPVVNVSSVPQRSPFRYPGGKTWLIPVARLWLGSLPSRPRRLFEPFAGGGGIGLAAAFEGFVDQSVLVELDPDVAAVWQSILGPSHAQLCKRILEFNCNLEAVKSEFTKSPETNVDRAFQTILRNRVTRGGILAPGAGLVKNGESGKGIASRWYPETLARRIGAINGHRERILCEQLDGLSVLEAQSKSTDSAFFIDPPYPIAGKRLYRFHTLDHRRLFELMSSLKSPFLATYDDNMEIRALALEFGFEMRCIPMKSTHHQKKLELVISRDLSWLASAEQQALPALPALA